MVLLQIHWRRMNLALRMANQVVMAGNPAEVGRGRPEAPKILTAVEPWHRSAVPLGLGSPDHSAAPTGPAGVARKIAGVAVGFPRPGRKFGHCR